MKNMTMKILAIITVILVAILMMMYSKIEKHVCPICNGNLTFQTQVYKDHQTYFRYECENNYKHVFDSAYKY